MVPLPDPAPAPIPPPASSGTAQAPSAGQPQQAPGQDRSRYLRDYMKNTYRKTRKSVNVVLTPAQYDRLQKNARAAGITPTALLREATFAYFDQRFRDAAFAFLEYPEGGQAGEQEGEQGGKQPGQGDRLPVTATPAAPAPASPPPAADVNEIRRLGVLLNQIARHVNTSKAVAVDELAACREIFTRIEERFGISQADEPPAEPQPATAQHPPDTAP